MTSEQSLNCGTVKTTGSEAVVDLHSSGASDLGPPESSKIPNLVEQLQLANIETSLSAAESPLQL